MEITEKEKFMYNVLACISNADTPIIFKGGLITKLVLAEGTYSSVSRHTQDIDANWVGDPPAMSSIRQIITEALGNLSNDYAVEITRAYNLERSESAGIALIEKATGDRVATIDMDIKPLSGSKTYYFGEVGIKGVVPDEIVADKISAISTDAVYKHRCKDLIDLYALSHCVQINTRSIFEVCKRNQRKILSFDGFYLHKSEVEHAYSKLRRIEGKPDFNELYEYLNLFLQPYKDHIFTNQIWNPSVMSWQPSQPEKSKRSDLTKQPQQESHLSMDYIKSIQLPQQERSDHQQTQNKKKDVSL